MKRFATLYFLFFVLLIVGAFASMAQNGYGLRICALACFGFAATFFYELVFTSRSEYDRPRDRWIGALELLSLVAVSVVFMLKNMLIDVAWTNIILILSGAVLLFLFIRHAIQHIGLIRKQEPAKLPAMVLLYSAVILFILTALASAFGLGWSGFMAVAGMCTAVGFGIVAWIASAVGKEQEKNSIERDLRQIRNKSIILLVAGVLIYGYDILFAMQALPPFYHGELPRGYHELVEVSEKSKDEQEWEKTREFKVRYEEFLEKYANN